MVRVKEHCAIAFCTLVKINLFFEPMLETTK